MRKLVCKLLVLSLLAALSSLTACFPGSPIAPSGVEIPPLQEAQSVTLSAQSESLLRSGSRFELSPATEISTSAFSWFRSVDPEDSVTALVGSNDGLRVYIGTRKGNVYAVELDETTVFANRRLLYASTRPVFALALSEDDSRLAIAQYSYVAVLQLSDNRLQSQLTLVDGRILSLAWDATGELLALGRANGDVFVWDGKTNNSRELERYSAATSPIIDVQFHPKARAMFVLERSGGLNLWRVLRTEYQLGLRDETADIDKVQQGNVVVGVGSLGGQAADLWLDAKGEQLAALSVNGESFSWSIRGLIRGQRVSVGPLNGAALEGVHFQFRQDQPSVPMILVGGRGQQLQIWCRSVKPSLLENPENAVAVVKPGEGLAPKPPVNPLLGEDDFYEEEEEEPEPEILAPVGLVASTPVMKSAIADISFASGRLWLLLGDGSLATLDMSQIASMQSFQNRAEHCGE